MVICCQNSIPPAALKKEYDLPYLGLRKPTLIICSLYFCRKFKVQWSFKLPITLRHAILELSFSVCIIWNIVLYFVHWRSHIFSSPNFLTARSEGSCQSLCHTYIFLSYGLRNRLLVLSFCDWLDKAPCIRRSTHRVRWYHVSSRKGRSTELFTYF